MIGWFKKKKKVPAKAVCPVCLIGDPVGYFYCKRCDKLSHTYGSDGVFLVEQARLRKISVEEFIALRDVMLAQKEQAKERTNAAALNRIRKQFGPKIEINKKVKVTLSKRDDDGKRK